MEQLLEFPTNFTWGAGTSAHQTEGNNVSSDWWQMEHGESRLLAEASGDACDSLHRYDEDIALLAAAGLQSYRFSIEWARIEPTQGAFSIAMLDHYQRMVDACLQRGVEPVLTLHHFTNPAWLRAAGGWRADETIRRFQRYAEWVTARLVGVKRYCTINEPNMIAAFAAMDSSDDSHTESNPDREVSGRLIAAHHAAAECIRSAGAQAGLTLAMTAYTLDGSDRAVEALEIHRKYDEDQFIEAARGDDFLGVQAYTRRFVSAAGLQPHGHDFVGPSEQRTLTGWNHYPEAIGDCLRRAHDLAPALNLLVTENGIATKDDEQRIAYTSAALESVLRAIADGIAVGGYWHWSLLDNFEWVHGYGPTFGLVAVDRDTFIRTPKPSLDWLGRVAKANALPA